MAKFNANKYAHAKMMSYAPKSEQPKKVWKINPAWVEYNKNMNEGGEGYNPHKKWL